MGLNRGYQRVYRAYLVEIPENPKGIELRHFNNLLPILRWHGGELVFYAYYDVTPENLLPCFYMMEKTEEATILRKLEGKVGRISPLKTTSYR